MGEQQKGDHADQPQRHQDFGMGEDHGYSFAAKHTATINPMAIARMPQITLTKMLAIDFMAFAPAIFDDGCHPFGQLYAHALGVLTAKRSAKFWTDAARTKDARWLLHIQPVENSV